MTPFGFSRSRIEREYALVCPDSFVSAPLPGWTKARGIVLIAPAIGARFTQYLADMEPGGTAAATPAGIERVVSVLEGSLAVQPPRGPEKILPVGGYAFVPSGSDLPLRAETACRINVFEKRYRPIAAVAVPRPVIGLEQDVEGAAFQGDPDAVLQTLLPDEPAFDLAVNIFTYQPGTVLPQVEVHVMEHGLLMLAGQGVYRLGNDWHPVQAGDAIWMASYCPQWFVAMGKTPARYLYYKDVNRDPLEIGR